MIVRAVYADTVGQMIEDTVNGFNSTVFAYGQTSSGEVLAPLVLTLIISFPGKTHTMYGAKGEEGVIDMAVNQLFYAMEETPNRKFLVMVSQTLTQGPAHSIQCRRPSLKYTTSP